MRLTSNIHNIYVYLYSMYTVQRKRKRRAMLSHMCSPACLSVLCSPVCGSSSVTLQLVIRVLQMHTCTSRCSRQNPDYLVQHYISENFVLFAGCRALSEAQHVTFQGTETHEIMFPTLNMWLTLWNSHSSVWLKQQEANLLVKKMQGE